MKVELYEKVAGGVTFIPDNCIVFVFSSDLSRDQEVVVAIVSTVASGGVGARKSGIFNKRICIIYI